MTRLGTVTLLALCLLCVLLPRSVVAQGGDPPSVTSPLPGPLFVMLPHDQPVRPGQEATYQFLLLDPIGLPLKGVPIAVHVDRGQVVRFAEQAGGLFEVVWQAPSEPAGGKATIQLRAALQEKSLTQSFPLEVRPMVRASLKLTLGASRLRLGVDGSVKVVIEGRGAEGGPIRPGDVTIVTNVGRVERLKEARSGRLEGIFVPGERLSPQAAIIAVFVGEGAAQQVAWAVLPLVGMPEVPVETEPGSSVWAEVGSVSYGPFKVDSSGTVRIPIQVPPGVREMSVRVQDAAGNTSRAVQDLSIPRFPRALLRLDRTSVRIDERAPVRITLLLVDAEGRPAALPSVPLEVTGGKLGGLVETGPGTFVATWEVPPRPGRQELHLTIPLPEGGVERYDAVLEVLEGLPSEVSIEVRPESMRTDDPPAEISVRVLDSGGNPATGVRPTAEAVLGVIEPFRTVGPGHYVSVFRPPSSLPEEMRGEEGAVDVPIRVNVQRLAGREAAERVELAVRPSVLVAGGEAVPVYARVWDRFGAPVVGARIKAVIESGDASISAEQETDNEGQASFRYVPGLKLGPVVIAAWVDGAPDRKARLMLIQAAREAPELELQSISAFARVAGGSDLGAVAQVRLVPGRVKRIQISALPNVLYLDTHQSSRIRVRLEDSAGNFVHDPTLTLLVTPGERLPWKLDDEGYYTAVYTPPVTLTPMTRVQVTASNPQREYAGVTELQLIRLEGLFMGAVRLGLVSNLSGYLSPTLSFQGMLRLPWRKPHLFLGGSAGYYAFAVEVAGRDGSIRYDLLPIQMFASYRHPLGRWTPYAGLGPMVAGYRASLDKALSETLELPERTYGLLPGLGGFIGLETGFGPGGIAIEAGVTWLKGGDQLQSVLDLDDNAGGLSLQGGYVAHF